jgi:hypothetical protein
MKKEIDLIEDLFGTSVDKKKERELFESLAHVEGLRDYLRATIADDVKRYYAASTPLEQALIRGASDRTRYFLKLLRERQAPVKAGSKKIPGVKRYA